MLTIFLKINSFIEAVNDVGVSLGLNAHIQVHLYQLKLEIILDF